MRLGNREGSLLSVIDRTVTPTGARLLADRIAAPMVQPAKIATRADAVAQLHADHAARGEIRKTLAAVYDLARLLGRLATGRTGPRDLQQIGVTLSRLPEIKTRLASFDSAMLRGLDQSLHPCPELLENLQDALCDECPVWTADGGYIRPGYDGRLDELQTLARGGKQWIAEYQAAQSQSTGIQNLKVGFNKVFGYYLEVTNPHKSKVPEHFIRKQTLKNCERYVTEELNEYEQKVLAADEQAELREMELFEDLRAVTHAHLPTLQLVAAALAELDVTAALAEIAAAAGWVRPTITDGGETRIVGGRHPVLDLTMEAGQFVPNDTTIGGDADRILLITGPNMAGKSTYIRQVALITLLAQLGSFVPAQSAEIGVADRIFARVGAADELSRGQSTFMVEMVETARILNTATDRSLVILDEIGRGTSTYDGLSLAWAITEHLHDVVKCRTLFATHYHELAALQETMTGVANYSVAVKEWNEEVVFMHRIIAGSADKSYGIAVARLAGVPASVNERAKSILSQLEADHRDGLDRPTIAPPSASGDTYQLTLFGYAEHPVVGRVKKLDVESISPMEALQFLHSIKAELS